MSKKISHQEVYNLIMELGVELSNHNHTWSNKLKRKFNSVTNYLSGEKIENK